MESSKCNYSVAFGKALKEIRLKKGKNQEQLAWDSNVDRAYTGRLERGTTNPSLAIIVKLSRGLEIEPWELIKRVMEIQQEIENS